MMTTREAQNLCIVLIVAGSFLLSIQLGRMIAFGVFLVMFGLCIAGEK